MTTRVAVFAGDELGGEGGGDVVDGAQRRSGVALLS